jgi:hypothetical protein
MLHAAPSLEPLHASKASWGGLCPAGGVSAGNEGALFAAAASALGVLLELAAVSAAAIEL